MPRLWALCLLSCYFNILCSGAGTDKYPVGVWVFGSDSEVTSILGTDMAMVVGRDVVIAEDNTHRYAFFDAYSESKLRIQRPEDMNFDNYFGLIFYLNYNVAYGRTLELYLGKRMVVFDLGKYVFCHNTSSDGVSNTIPVLQVHATYGLGYEVNVGDPTTCTKKTVSQSYYYAQGWIRHVISITRDDIEWEVRLSDPTSSSSDYGTGSASVSYKFADDYHDFYFGDAAFTVDDVSDNLMGGLACIQFFKRKIVPWRQSYHDVCASNSAIISSSEQNIFIHDGNTISTSSQLATTTTATTTTTTAPPPTTTTTTPESTTTTATTTDLATTTTTTTTTTTPLHQQQTTSTTIAATSCVKCCYCSCAKTPDVVNISSSEFQEIMDEIIETLTVDKQSLSQKKRKKTSAQDERQSAQVLVSIVGIGLCSFVGALIIGMDLVGICTKGTDRAACC